jgi:hypothetical protein
MTGSPANLTTIAPKLAKMLLMLSSDCDHEVVAAARAIDKALQNAGFDWHDLAAAVHRMPIPSDAGAEWYRQRDERSNISWCLNRCFLLSVQDREFLETVSEQRKPLSPKQQQWLSDIRKKLERTVAA